MQLILIRKLSDFMWYIAKAWPLTPQYATNLFAQSHLKMRSANQRHCERYDILIISYLLFVKPNPCCGWWNLRIAYLLMMRTFFGWLSTAAAQSRQRKKFKWLQNERSGLSFSFFFLPGRTYTIDCAQFCYIYNYVWLIFMDVERFLQI